MGKELKAYRIGRKGYEKKAKNKANYSEIIEKNKRNVQTVSS